MNFFFFFFFFKITGWKFQDCVDSDNEHMETLKFNQKILP